MFTKGRFTAVLGITALAVFAGCDNGTGDPDGGDGVARHIRNLPSFEGAFVADEAEATTLAMGADAAIQAEISGLVPSLSRANISAPARAVQNGRYSDNGITIDYTVTYPDNFESTYSGTVKIRKQ